MRIVLLSAEGVSGVEIAPRVGPSSPAATLKEAGRSVQQIKPVFFMSPLSVAGPGHERWFEPLVTSL